jgi:hypothetical protein
MTASVTEGQCLRLRLFFFYHKEFCVKFSFVHSCYYQKYAKQQEGIIRYLENEIKAASEEIYKLKAGNVSRDFME